MFRAQYNEDTFVDAFKRMADALERIADKQPNPPISNPVTIEHVFSHLRAGEKIQAIKAMRQITGAGLKDAKDMVEALVIV